MKRFRARRSAGSIWPLAPIVLALAVAGVAYAANASSYMDAAGDAASAPDITSVQVSNDEPGAISFNIAIGNRTALGSDDFVLVFLDADGKEDSEGMLHAEYGVAYGVDGPEFFIRAIDTGNFVPLPSALLTSLSGSFSGGTLSLVLHQADLDNTSTLNFWVRAGTEVDESFDEAPDGSDVFEYRVVSPALYVLGFKPPATAKAGQRLVAGFELRGGGPSGRVICTATAAGKKIAGKGDWFTITVNNRVKYQPRCTWVVPKAAKGKVLRGTVSVEQSGLKVARSFSVKVR